MRIENARRAFDDQAMQIAAAEWFRVKLRRGRAENRRRAFLRPGFLPWSAPAGESAATETRR